jgi:hypothetical protein
LTKYRHFTASLLEMIAAALGYLPPIGGAISKEIIDLAAVLNAVRWRCRPVSCRIFKWKV